MRLRTIVFDRLRAERRATLSCFDFLRRHGVIWRTTLGGIESKCRPLFLAINYCSKIQWRACHLWTHFLKLPPVFEQQHPNLFLLPSPDFSQRFLCLALALRSALKNNHYDFRGLGFTNLFRLRARNTLWVHAVKFARQS